MYRMLLTGRLYEKEKYIWDTDWSVSERRYGRSKTVFSLWTARSRCDTQRLLRNLIPEFEKDKSENERDKKEDNDDDEMIDSIGSVAYFDLLNAKPARVSCGF